MTRNSGLAVSAIILFFSGCASTPPQIPSLPLSEVEALLPSELLEKKGWAEDIISAIEQTDRPATIERVCAVVAVIGQESGFQIDPPVKDLPGIVRRGLERKFAKLGPLAAVAVSAVLKVRAPGTKESFAVRIKKLRTESDLDRLFREIEASMREHFPGPTVLASLVAKLVGQGWLEDFNPVTTLGPMQVKVTYAKTLRGMKRLSDGEVRDLLYTRRGGVRAGVARLLDYEAGYDDPIYRFADYNVGIYSSRNAAFQKQLSELSRITLVPDGDLLVYRTDGKIEDEDSETLRAIRAFSETHDIPEREARRTTRLEKTSDFERSDLWRKVRVAWQKKTGREPGYAVIPRVTLDSPKISHRRTTEWFAKNVKARYERCRLSGNRAG